MQASQSVRTPVTTSALYLPHAIEQCLDGKLSATEATDCAISTCLTAKSILVAVADSISYGSTAISTKEDMFNSVLAAAAMIQTAELLLGRIE